MGRTYSVPRNVKGESRILYIFTIRSFMFTLGFAAVGFIISFIFSLVGLALVGWIIMGIFAALGFAIGSLVIPDSQFVGALRKAGGERVGDILFRTATFSRRKKIYVYREGGNK